MEKTITLSNSFHNTKITIRTPRGYDQHSVVDAYHYLRRLAEDGDKNAARRARRIHAKLCGSHDCTCGVVR